jgi:hypothetical protein
MATVSQNYRARLCPLFSEFAKVVAAMAGELRKAGTGAPFGWREVAGSDSRDDGD